MCEPSGAQRDARRGRFVAEPMRSRRARSLRRARRSWRRQLRRDRPARARVGVARPSRSRACWCAPSRSTHCGAGLRAARDIAIAEQRIRARAHARRDDPRPRSFVEQRPHAIEQALLRRRRHGRLFAARARELLDQLALLRASARSAPRPGRGPDDRRAARSCPRPAGCRGRGSGTRARAACPRGSAS